MATREDTAKVLAVAMLGYPSMKAQPAEELARMIELYCAKLADFPAEAISAAVDVCGGEWFPSVYKLRDACAHIMAGQLVKRPALEAWEDVTRAIETHGRFNNYSDQIEAGMNARHGMPGAVSDPVAQAVVNAIGWNTLCDGDNPAADRARFIEMYDQKRAVMVETLRLTPAARDLNARQIEARTNELTKRLTSPAINTAVRDV